ncbi:MAG: type II toxin-antitoxin system VapC family toxin [Planctomycetes bacterium]|nr:type II toxin-antitoxin system VapC family toxin [Planctomycetota bacterium]
MTYLLDTNVWITVLRDPTSSLAARFRSLAPHNIRVCSVVVAELRHGCMRSAKSAANRAAIDALLAPFASLPFDDEAAEHFAKIRNDLEIAGRMIGPYDLQIAAIGLARNCTVVTHNTAEFSRIAGLPLEDWQVF